MAHSSETLASCPFCGGERTLEGAIKDGWSLECMNLDCRGQVRAYALCGSDARAKAYKRWNTRASPVGAVAGVEEVAKLREAIVGAMHRLQAYGETEEGVNDAYRVLKEATR